MRGGKLRRGQEGETVVRMYQIKKNKEKRKLINIILCKHYTCVQCIQIILYTDHIHLHFPSLTYPGIPPLNYLPNFM